MGKAVQSLLFRWDTDFVDELRIVAGPRGMSRFVRQAVENALRSPASLQTLEIHTRPRPADTDFDNWGA